MCTIFGEGFQQLFTALREDRDQLIASVSIVFYIWSRLLFGRGFLLQANLIQATFCQKMSTFWLFRSIIGGWAEASESSPTAIPRPTQRRGAKRAPPPSPRAPSPSPKRPSPEPSIIHLTPDRPLWRLPTGKIGPSVCQRNLFTKTLLVENNL